MNTATIRKIKQCYRRRQTTQCRIQTTKSREKLRSMWKSLIYIKI